MAAFEKAHALDDVATSRFYRMNSLAKQAFGAGEDDKAAKYASELLELADFIPNDWKFGNAIHDGNTISGRLALKRGDPKKASEYLLKAGGTKGSPQLNSFGPNMNLAKELLESGEKDVVLQYFTLCGKFWKSGGERLAAWSGQVAAGETPDFGANLNY